MKRVITYIQEKLKISKKYFRYYPKTRMELTDIIDKKLEDNHNIDERGLKIIDVSDIDISNINRNNISCIFAYYDNIKEIQGLENWDVSGILKMHELFKECKNLEYIKGIENWDVSNVIDFCGIFAKCESLQNLDLSNWKVQKSAKTTGMFDGCNKNMININYKTI